MSNPWLENQPDYLAIRRANQWMAEAEKWEARAKAYKTDAEDFKNMCRKAIDQRDKAWEDLKEMRQQRDNALQMCATIKAQRDKTIMRHYEAKAAALNWKQTMADFVKQHHPDMTWDEFIAIPRARLPAKIAEMQAELDKLGLDPRQVIPLPDHCMPR